MASKRTPPEAETTAWHVIMGSARGAAHHAAGLPNEDSGAQQAIGDPPAGVVVAVADGHGHERHFRSAAGSALAVDVACQVASRLAADLGARTREDEVDGAVRDDLVRGIVLHWRAAVGKHIAMRPYTAEEQSALGLAGDGPEIPYGATLLLAMVAGRWLVCAQIGDGDLLAIRPDGRSFRPVAGDSRLDGQRTTSLCQPDAVASFRTSAHNLREMPLLALLVATDGYGNAQSADRWQPGVGRDLARLAAEHDRRWFEWQVPSWAERCASADGSGDDTTIALLLQPGAALPADRLVRRRSRRVPARQTVPGPPDPAGVVTAVPTAPAASPAAEAPGPVSPVPPRTAGARPAGGAGQAGSGGRRRGIIAAVIVAIIVAAVLATMAVVLLRQPWAGTSSPSGTVNNAPTGHRTASRTQLPSPAASVPGQGGKNAKSPATSGAQTPTSDVTGAGQQKGG